MSTNQVSFGLQRMVTRKVRRRSRRRYFPRARKRPLTRYLSRIASRGFHSAAAVYVGNLAHPVARAVVQCPAVLSLVDATDAAVVFLNAITRQPRRTTHVFVDMRPAQRITADGYLALLIAVKSCSCRVSGNLPTAQQPLDLMLRSGFQNHVAQHRWERRQTQGYTERSGVNADGAEAARVVEFACNKLGIPPMLDRNSYKVLVECMANTRNHASRKLRGGRRSAPEKWYVHVYFDEARGVVCFCFADVGSGIIRSLQLDPSAKLRKVVMSLLRGSGHTAVLRDVLEGRIKSSTQFENRGLGLPKIASLAKAGYMRRLVIISNRAHLDCVDDSGSDTVQEFSGTLLYWEVGKVEL
jgi:hypothetical protein